MKCAAIDIGTNTVLLLIAEVGRGQVTEILDVSTITRLGEGLKQNGLLGQGAMERVYACLKSYRGLISDHGVEETWCVGTSALREASNSPLFLERVQRELGFRVEVISGDREACYTYLSVRHEEWVHDKAFVIVDIGGGSTEIIEGDRETLGSFVSLPIGSVRMTEMCIHHDPPAEGDLRSLAEHIREIWPLSVRMQGRLLVETGGTITNLATILLGLENYDKQRIHGLAITMESIVGVIDRFRHMTTAERACVRGMEKGREDIFLQGIVIMREIMLLLGAGEVLVSTNGVRYGLLYERAAGSGIS